MDPENLEKKSLMCLPIEVLILILEPFPTRILLPTRTVSRCWYSLVVRIIHDRLALAMPSKDHTLILESYHPSTKSIEPPLFCHYVRTPGLSHDGRILYGSRSESSIAQLRSLYSHFRPVRQTPGSKYARPHPAGQVPGSRTSEVAKSSSPGGAAQDAPPSHSINLEPYEPFSQLCVAIHRAQVDQRGFFYSIVNVTDSVVRIFRPWLAQRAKSCDEKSVAASSQGIENIPEEHKGSDDENDDGNILWVDDRKHVGIRVRVKENAWKRNAPVLLLKDEDLAVSYTLEHEELLVRTTCLLQAAEQALMEQNNISGKAMILGPFI